MCCCPLCAPRPTLTRLPCSVPGTLTCRHSTDRALLPPGDPFSVGSWRPGAGGERSGVGSPAPPVDHAWQWLHLSPVTPAPSDGPSPTAAAVSGVW